MCPLTDKIIRNYPVETKKVYDIKSKYKSGKVSSSSSVIILNVNELTYSMKRKKLVKCIKK